ncbi:MAG TPA: GTP cyclohydrolase I [Acidimicrobiia bacterium]|nr:GTP cyclohydrolase I [Acidimicrobiia bacterium]
MLPIETGGAAADAGSYEDVVVVRDLRVRARCACHRLPVDALLHVGYLPAGRLVATGDLADAVTSLARDEWVQPEAAAHVADWVVGVSGARGVGVVVESRFSCAGGDGREGRAALLTTTTRGALRDDAVRRGEFLAALRRGHGTR